MTQQRNQAIERLHSLFAMHGVAHGSPEHLRTFLREVQENRHLAMDFWALVNAVSDSGSGTLSETELLEAVVEGTAGVASDALPAEEAAESTRLSQLLAGIDLTRPENLDDPRQDPFLRAAANSEAVRLEAEARREREAFAADMQQRRRSIGDALEKMEQNMRELRTQLAELDAQTSGSHRTASPATVEPALHMIRIADETQNETRNRWNRMSPFSEERLIAEQSVAAHNEPKVTDEHSEESRIDSTTVNRVSSPHLTPPLASADSSEVMHPPVAPAFIDPVAVDAVVVDPVVVTTRLPEPAMAAATEENSSGPLGRHRMTTTLGTDEPALRSPFSSFEEESKPAGAPRWLIGIVAAAVLAATTYAGAVYTGTGRSLLQQLGVAVPGFTAPPAPATSAPPRSAEESSATQSSDAASTATAAPAIPAVPAAAPIHSADRPAATPPADTRRARVSQTPVDEGLPRIPPSIMAANLITSRVPAYPEAARAQGVEGSVLLDVVVTSSGTVESAHATGGDHRLRAAAEEAVMRWHYKPYPINGEPAEVITTVRVDFRLPESE